MPDVDVTTAWITLAVLGVGGLQVGSLTGLIGLARVQIRGDAPLVMGRSGPQKTARRYA